MDPKSFTIKALEKTKNFLSDSENNTLEAAVIVKKVLFPSLEKDISMCLEKERAMIPPIPMSASRPPKESKLKTLM